MNERREPGVANPTADAGHQVELLLRLAGLREPVPPERLRRLKAAAQAGWREQTRTRARLKVITWSFGAVAAAALVLVGVRLTVPVDVAPPGAAPTLATIETLRGAVRLLASGERAREPALFQVGDGIRAGDGVDSTSGGQAALRLTGGASVRLDGGTRLRVLSDLALALDQGRIYIDSGGTRGAGSLEVRTPIGVARDIGTRFEVRFDGAALRVRVRDGLVQLSQSQGVHGANAGDELTLDGAGDVVRRTVPVYGDDWAWARAVARPFGIEGRSLHQFLSWMVGENGWQLRFTDAAVEQKARATILHGSIEGLTPEEALAAVLPSAGMEHELNEGVLLVWLGEGRTMN